MNTPEPITNEDLEWELKEIKKKIGTLNLTEIVIFSLFILLVLIIK